MKSYFWKFTICLLPCVLAGIICWRIPAKLGTDLSGGTNLVYEIDQTRTRDDKGFNKETDTNVLAEALKRRIDPNDLYNIVIRPAGGEGRVEIILPTGGAQTANQAQTKWDDLLKDLEKAYGVKLDVPRGKIFEVADQIQIQRSTDKWEHKLFRDPKDAKDGKDGKDKVGAGEKAWANLKKHAVEYWAQLEPYKKQLDELDGKENRLKELSAFIVTTMSNTEKPTTENVVKTFVKKEAWAELLNRIAQWKALGVSDAKEELNQIEPDSFDQLIGFVQSRGVLPAQAGLAIIEPLVGSDLAFSDGTPSRREIEEFIEENYGESAASILKKIEANRGKEGGARDLTLDEIQRIKDLVAKVGSLEFRILSNQHDDADGQNKAIEMLTPTNADASMKEQLKKAEENGLPPPAPPDPYTIKLPTGTSKVRYEWVELGPQERKSLHLDNAARTDKDVTKRHNWHAALSGSKKGAFRIPDGPNSTRNLLHGALFYRRECQNRNLTEEERRKKEVEYFLLTRTPEYDPADLDKPTPKIEGKYLTSARPSTEGIENSVAFTFDNEGSRLFGNITRKNVPDGEGGEDAQRKRYLAIILDDLIMSAPGINSVITSNGQITGGFSRKEVDALVNILRAGRLPATLKPQPVSETTMGATLGEDTVKSGVFAVGLAFAAVLVFMCVYYRLAGFVACIALLANLLLTVGFMLGVQATFTLPGLAGLVLMLGMAVDANVLIYERLREERERGAALPVALRNAYGRALPTIIDTHLSSIFTAVVLYVVGNDQLKGFGVSLTAGLVISLFTSLYMTHVIFDWLMAKRIFTDFRPLRLFGKPNFDFMRIRHVMFGGTLVLAVLGMVLFIYRLPDDLNIDFTGGTAYSGQLTRHLSIQDLRKFFDDKHQAERLQFDADGVVEEKDSDGKHFLVKYKGETEGRVIVLVDRPDGDTETARAENVKRRLKQFPDVSIEQMFPSGPDYPKAGETPYFTVRTSEKSTEIVQTVLDRLLYDVGGKKELLKKVYLKTDPLGARDTRLRFFDEKGETAEASPAFVKTLFTRELFKQFGVDKMKDLPVTFDVYGEAASGPDGKFKVARVRFEADLTPEQKTKVEGALAKLVTAFQSRPQPDRLENFDSQLANETRYRAMWAILASWVAIAVYLWFRFGNWTFGLAAVVCLVHDLFLTLGVVAACHYLQGTFIGSMLALDDFKIDLPAVAAFLTLVGYSVNDTIVVFDRIREVRGKNPDLTEKMINDSVNQTLSRTVLASLTTWLVVFVLYAWGGPGVHLFAFVMVVGVIIGTFSSIYVASPLLLMLGEGHKETGPGGKASPKSTAIQPA